MALLQAGLRQDGLAKPDTAGLLKTARRSPPAPLVEAHMKRTCPRGVSVQAWSEVNIVDFTGGGGLLNEALNRFSALQGQNPREIAKLGPWAGGLRWVGLFQGGGVTSEWRGQACLDKPLWCVSCM